MRESNIGIEYDNFNFDRIVNIIRAERFPTTFPLHWHKYVEIIAIPNDLDVSPSSKKIPAVIVVNQEKHFIQPLDLVLIWPEELHEIIHNEGNRMIGIQFPITLLSSIPEFAQNMNLFRSFHHIRNANMPELAKEMVTSIVRMLQISERNKSFQGVEIIICLYEMFMSLGSGVHKNFLEDTFPSSSMTNQTIEKIDNACSYIAENCRHALTLNDIATYTGFSAHYFSRIFKKATTYNFIEYLTQQRIKNAQALLSDTDLPITEISYQSGFKSISTFNRVFKKYKGCSPREFRAFFSNK